jgi:hypothetical protein
MEPVSLSFSERDLRRAVNAIEALCNLNYLICEEAVHPDKVRLYESFRESAEGDEWTAEPNARISLVLPYDSDVAPTK